MSTPHDLIRAIVDEDFVAAKEITNNLVFAAVSDELEVAKMEVAANLFNDCEDCGGEDIHERQATRPGDAGYIPGTPIPTPNLQRPSDIGKYYFNPNDQLNKRPPKPGSVKRPGGTLSNTRPAGVGNTTPRQNLPTDPTYNPAVTEGQMSANRYGGGKSFDWKKPHPSNAKDYDKDGKIESPKDEVHGSHINAAVKAGKLSPSAASKTKNKGKYR